MLNSPSAGDPVAAAFKKFPPAAGSPLDHAIWNARDLAAANAEIARLRGELAESNAYIETLQSLLDNAVVSTRLWAEVNLLNEVL